ncbi:MAG: leucyl aminopeptidase family protein [Thermoanaerobaculia bacterium]
MNELVQLEIAGEGVLETEVLVAGCFEGEGPPVAGLPGELARAVERAAARPGFAGRKKQWSEVTPESGPVGSVVLQGLGKRSEFGIHKLLSWLDRCLESLRVNGVESCAVVVPDAPEGRGAEAAERICRRLALGAYRFDRYLDATDRAPIRLRRAAVVPPPGDGQAAAYREALATARATAEGVRVTRNLANTPANVADPEWMEERARELGESLGMGVRVLRRPDLEELGMEGILAVGKGSATPPRLVRMEWGTEGPVVALVGKGITFDTGGISIKPSARLDEMKYDKTGACTVLGIAAAVGRLELPVRLRLYLPLAENMPDGAAYRPGDILRTYSGKTVEVLNTDAEGRLILADALTLAVEEGAEALLEYSTLTGACVVALGHHGAGLFTPDDALAGELLQAAEAGGERLWRLPLWPEFREEMRGHHADLKNSGGRWGGASTAASFLASFVGEHQRWAHLDIAGPSQNPEEDDGKKKGATGYGVALAVHWLRGLASRA